MVFTNMANESLCLTNSTLLWLHSHPCSIVPGLSVTISPPLQSLPSGICHVKWFHLKTGGKKTTLFSKTAIWQDSSQCEVSIHLHPISHSGLRSAVATSLRIDHTRRSWNILTGPMSSLPPNSLRDWFHFAIQHIPPPRSLRIIPPLTAVICYSYFLCSGKWSFRLSLELKWNRSYIVLKVLPFSSSCLAAFTVAIFSPGRKWNTVKSNGTMYKTDCVLLFG